ncbi:hypothetical protein OsI_05834 [Oryza sativa Indica Group]|uniref:Uncharacterized protein n=1 Tax=Oryza sativa subsp. indica TaxID=39946 RepID=B8AHU5_ORYSI|nr:hypothetical protein OsI_05834 [Oryza sativa Indica Group]
MEETRRQRRRRKRECECQPRDGATATLRSPRRRRSPLRWPTSHRILSPPPSPSSPSWRSPSYPPSPRTPRLMPVLFCFFAKFLFIFRCLILLVMRMNQESTDSL